MPQLEKSLATLRVIGDSLIPDEITKLLGTEPTRAEIKGQVLWRFESGRERLARFGAWQLDAAACEPEDVDGQIAEILEKVTDNLDAWTSLTGRYRVELFCGWFMASRADGLSISPENLVKLGERGIEFQICLYAPDEPREMNVSET